MEIREYLSSKGFDWTEKERTGGLNAIMNCPFCDDSQKKFAISLTNGAFQCFHQNSCGIKGSWWDFQKKLGDQPRRLINDPFVRPPKINYQKPKPRVQKIDTEVDKYLKSRGFTVETIKHFSIAKKNRAIAIPYFKNKESVNV